MPWCFYTSWNRYSDVCQWIQHLEPVKGKCKQTQVHGIEQLLYRAGIFIQRQQAYSRICDCQEFLILTETDVIINTVFVPADRFLHPRHRSGRFDRPPGLGLRNCFEGKGGFDRILLTVEQDTSEHFPEFVRAVDFHQSLTRVLLFHCACQSSQDEYLDSLIFLGCKDQEDKMDRNTVG